MISRDGEEARPKSDIACGPSDPPSSQQSHPRRTAIFEDAASINSKPEQPTHLVPANEVSTKCLTCESFWTRCRNVFRLVPADATPLRWSIIANTVVSLFICVVNITMLFPYLPQMTRDMGTILLSDF